MLPSERTIIAVRHVYHPEAEHYLVTPAGLSFTTHGVVPFNFMPCDGRALSQAAFPELFSAIGYVYGIAPAPGMFLLPNLGDQREAICVCGHDRDVHEWSESQVILNCRSACELRCKHFRTDNLEWLLWNKNG